MFYISVPWGMGRSVYFMSVLDFLEEASEQKNFNHWNHSEMQLWSLRDSCKLQLGSGANPQLTNMYHLIYVSHFTFSIITSSFLALLLKPFCLIYSYFLSHFIAFRSNTTEGQISVEGKEIENVERFTRYLGSIVKCDPPGSQSTSFKIQMVR